MQWKTLIKKWNRPTDHSYSIFQTQICNYLYSSRGFYITPKNIISTRSTEMSLYIVSQLLIKRNDTVLVGSLSSTTVGTKMPGPGSVWLDQNLRFLLPVRIGDIITVTSEILVKIPDRRHVIVRTTCTNQNEEVVIEGVGLHKILNV